MSDLKTTHKKQIVNELPEGVTPPLLVVQISLSNDDNLSGNAAIEAGLQPIVDAIAEKAKELGHNHIHISCGAGFFMEGPDAVN
jgi:hypothetical protein